MGTDFLEAPQHLRLRTMTMERMAVNMLCLVCVYREAGLECQEVPGHSKGIGHRPGQSLKKVKSDHLWNAVLLGGQWFLMDACWGAGRVDMEHECFVKRSFSTFSEDLQITQTFILNQII